MLYDLLGFCANGGGVCVSEDDACPEDKPFQVGSCCTNEKCCAGE